MTDTTESYNVLNEPWIPVRNPDGTIRELGIYEVLARAHELDEITDSNIMIEYGLYRLLITFLLDALRPQDVADLEDILAAGRIDMAKIDTYIEACRNEGITFDLFDKEHPFLQVPYKRDYEKKKGPVTAIDHTIPKGNNHVHFVHQGKNPATLSFAQAARHLPVMQLFCPMGGRGYPVGINGTPYYTIIRGRNLFESLVYSLPEEDAFHNLDLDNPPVCWRTGIGENADKELLTTSIMCGMLFPARSIHLFAEHGVCNAAYIGPGLKLKTDPKQRTWLDPHVSYIKTDKGTFPWAPQRARSIWRNIAQLTEKNCRPAILSIFEEIAGASKTAQLQLYGVQTDQAAFLNGMRHNISLPLRLSEKRLAAQTVLNLVEDAESLARTLRESLSAQDEHSGGPIIGASLRDAYIQQYYDACEKDFWPILGQLAEAQGEEPVEIHREWIDRIGKHAADSYNQLLQSLSLRGDQLFALAEENTKLSRATRRLKKKIKGEADGKR